MPKEGFKTVTIDSKIYDKIESEIGKANQKAGFRKYRSVSHFVEEAIINYEP
jgi:hypothetical protein